jgi:hypothetical protein
MTPPILPQVRPGRSGCPSDLALDRHAAGETQADEDQRIRDHVAGCAHCAAHLRERRFEELPNGAAMLARLRARVDADAASKRRGWLRLLPALGLAAAGLAAGLLVIVRPPSSGTGPGTDTEIGVRTKGAPVLRVHRQTQQGSEEILSGATLPPGTAIRFVVDLPAEGFVSVLGVEERGGLYTAWPIQASQAGQPEAAATRRPAGAGQALPGAVILDDSLGREVLYLIHCPAAPPRCVAGEAGAPPRCQEGCARAPFVIVKRRVP